MADKKEKFTITVVGGDHKITIQDSSGNKKELNSTIVSGGSPSDGETFLWGWGHPKDAAASLAEGLSRSQDYPEREWWLAFVECLCEEMAIRTLPKGKPLTMEEINKWEDKDQRRWAYYDSEDVLEDKQKSEEKKKTYH